MKKTLALGFVIIMSGVLLLTACTNLQTAEKKAVDTTYTVTGTIRGVESGRIDLGYYFDDEEFSDSARIVKGKFSFKGKVEYPQVAVLTMGDGDDYQRAIFYLDNGTTVVSAGADSLALADISGTAVQDEYKSYTVAMKSFEDRMEAFELAYESADPESQEVIDSLEDVYNQLIAQKLIAIKNYVQAHPESFVAATEVLNNFAYDPKVDQFDSVYNFMGPTIKETPVGKKIREELDIFKKTDVGQIAPDFTLNDVNGNPRALSSFKGKVLLVDFWASWCGPCRDENPNIVEAYQKFHARGFDVLGVSLDTKKEKWLKAIKDDRLTWNHISDLEGWNSAAGKVYGIHGIPMSYLLDKEGKIIAKNLRGDDLVQKLEEVLR